MAEIESLFVPMNLKLYPGEPKSFNSFARALIFLFVFRVKLLIRGVLLWQQHLRHGGENKRETWLMFLCVRRKRHFSSCLSFSFVPPSETFVLCAIMNLLTQTLNSRLYISENVTKGVLFHTKDHWTKNNMKIFNFFSNTLAITIGIYH